jgi:hypothetical protein
VRSQLLAKLRELSSNVDGTEPVSHRVEIEAILARRDKIVILQPKDRKKRKERPRALIMGKRLGL